MLIERQCCIPSKRTCVVWSNMEQTTHTGHAKSNGVFLWLGTLKVAIILSHLNMFALTVDIYIKRTPMQHKRTHRRQYNTHGCEKQTLVILVLWVDYQFQFIICVDLESILREKRALRLAKVRPNNGLQLVTL